MGEAAFEQLVRMANAANIGREVSQNMTFSSEAISRLGS